MLAQDQIEIISKGFGVYDHDWRFYAEFLGEPYFINDVLVYFDGEIVFICAFPVGDVWREMSVEEIEAILNSKGEFQRAKGVDVWGRLSNMSEELRVGSGSLAQSARFDYDPHYFDVAISVENFDYQANFKARLARNAAANQGLTTQVTQRSNFTARHIQLIRHWMSTHDVSAIHTSFAIAINSFIKQHDVYLVEVYEREDLNGFAVISLPTEDKAVMTQCYFENRPGKRFADSTMAACLEFAGSRGIRRLHLGYSASDSLLRFKRKWGADWNGPSFREAFYVISAEIAKRFQSGFHPWCGWLLAQQFDRHLGEHIDGA
jgi:hypothetical protein